MGKIFRRGIDFSGGGSSISNQTASSVTFNNTDTGLAAANVQDAITEVNGKLNAKFVWTRLSNVQTDLWGNLNISIAEHYIPILAITFSNYIGMLYQKSSYEWFVHFMMDNQDHLIASNVTFDNLLILCVRDPNYL